MKASKPWNIGPVTNQYLMIRSKDAEEFMESEDGKIVPLFWSENGWELFYSAQKYRMNDYFILNLPLGGEWVLVDTISTFTCIGDHFTLSETYQITPNPEIFPDIEGSDEYFRVI